MTLVEAVLGDFTSLALLAASAMVPITLASIGEIASERAGIVNIGLEGIMLASAWAAVAVYIMTGWGPLAGYLLGALLGLSIGVLHGVVSVYLKGDQIVTGVGLNIFSAGATVVGTYMLWGTFSNSPPVEPMPGFVIAGVRISPMVPISLAAGAAVWLFLYRTTTGLRLRSCGEDPRSAEAMGVNVALYQIAAAGFAGLMAGLAGAYLSIDYQGVFAKNMTAGRGFIALANVAFSGWNPLVALLGSYVFGFSEALAIYLNIVLEATAASNLVNTIPYIATLAAVTLIAFRKPRMPAWLGRPYIKE
ncbi:ABC transporter permease [Aeropyrum camini SY1 = JCM 12091]|uniref:ABC transporter permease n=1 Tax=Aeropyrum camini SY1 = JCM 12091 TaxID=1198449 RepID=U3TF48_9CREN|nr:ABC transporter permease [Aeropyrum camini SY1 = JCM 12091]